MKIKLNGLFYVWTALLFCFGVSYAYYYFYVIPVDGFSISSVTGPLKSTFNIDLKMSEADENKAYGILAQNFFYLGRGRQVFAFCSADGKYVIKFMRRHPAWKAFWKGNIRPWIRRLSGKKTRLKPKDPLKSALRSSVLAYTLFREETGLVFMHLQPQEKEGQKVLIFDKVGQKHLIDMAKTSFVIQRKADLIQPVFQKLVQEKRIVEAQSRINHIFWLMQDRAKKGIVCPDPMMIKRNNIGFLEDRCIYIDIGSFSHPGRKKALNRFKHDLKYLKPLESWLDSLSSDLSTYFRMARAQSIQEIEEAINR